MKARRTRAARRRRRRGWSSWLLLCCGARRALPRQVADAIGGNKELNHELFVSEFRHSVDPYPVDLDGCGGSAENGTTRGRGGTTRMYGNLKRVRASPCGGGDRGDRRARGRAGLGAAGRGRLVPAADAQHPCRASGATCCGSASPGSCRATCTRTRCTALCSAGRWRYLEHDWVAETGSYVFEPPGEIHTLTVPEDCAEMITFFNITGSHGLSRRGERADRLRGHLHQDRHVQRALRPRAGSAPTTSTSSSAERRGYDWARRLLRRPAGARHRRHLRHRRRRRRAPSPGPERDGDRDRARRRARSTRSQATPTSGRGSPDGSTCATRRPSRGLVGGLPALDVLVNCAGVIRARRELDPAVFAEVVDVNLTGAMRVCAAARPLLAAPSGGSIVNPASMLVLLRRRPGARLCGEQGRHRAADQVAGDRLRRRRHPGERRRARAGSRTPLTARAAGGSRAARGAILARTPLGRWGEPRARSPGPVALPRLARRVLRHRARS